MVSCRRAIKSLRVGKARVATALYHAEAFVSLPKSAPSRIIRAKPAATRAFVIVLGIDATFIALGSRPASTILLIASMMMRRQCRSRKNGCSMR